MDNFWSIGIAVFLCVLSFVKYTDTDQLKAWIEDFLCRISPLEVIEEEDVVELDEITDIISDFVIRNQEIFSKLKVKNEPTGTEGIKEES
tara:strand:+ start:2386 stop:2655 length:270 start_codon:yes stop_codon:yes gene_type:complete